MTVEEVVKALRKMDWNKSVYFEFSQMEKIPKGYEWDTLTLKITGVNETAGSVFLDAELEV